MTFFANDNGYIYSASAGTFEDTSMPRRAYHAMCGAATTPEGDRVVVVAGGYDRDTFHPMDRTDIYNPATGVWTEGPRLPVLIENGVAVQGER